MFEELPLELQLSAGYAFSGALFDMGIVFIVLVVVTIIRGMAKTLPPKTKIVDNIYGIGATGFLLGCLLLWQLMTEEKNKTEKNSDRENKVYIDPGWQNDLKTLSTWDSIQKLDSSLNFDIQTDSYTNDETPDFK